MVSAPESARPPAAVRRRRRPCPRPSRPRCRRPTPTPTPTPAPTFDTPPRRRRRCRRSGQVLHETARTRRAIRPFPVVRMRGRLTATGARVTLLSVRAPRAAKITVRCKGRCPTAAGRAAKRKSRLTRMGRFERSLRSGTRITVSVTRRRLRRQADHVRDPARRAPLRTDRCLSSQGPRDDAARRESHDRSPDRRRPRRARRRVFVAAFSAAAVTAPRQRRRRRGRAARTAPAAAQEKRGGHARRAVALARRGAARAAPARSAQAGKKKAKRRQAEGRRAPARARRPRRAAAAATAAPPRAVTPPRRTGRESNVGKTFDLRGMIRRQAHGHERPSLRWIAAGLAVALAAAVGGWLGRRADRRRSGDAVAAGRPKELDAGPGAAEGLDRLGRAHAAAGAARARGRAGLDAVLRPGHDRLGRAGARRRRRRWCPPRSSRTPTAGCRGPRRRASSGSRRARTAACARGDVGPRRLRDPDDARRADARLLGPQRRPGGARPGA